MRANQKEQVFVRINLTEMAMKKNTRTHLFSSLLIFLFAIYPDPAIICTLRHLSLSVFPVSTFSSSGSCMGNWEV